MNFVAVCALLWLFLLGLKLMGEAFKGMFGTGVRWGPSFRVLWRKNWGERVPLALVPGAPSDGPWLAREVGKLMSNVLNPMAGLALGVLCTVLLQSSSTTTSIIVTARQRESVDRSAQKRS